MEVCQVKKYPHIILYFHQYRMALFGIKPLVWIYPLLSQDQKEEVLIIAYIPSKNWKSTLKS